MDTTRRQGQQGQKQACMHAVCINKPACILSCIRATHMHMHATRGSVSCCIHMSAHRTRCGYPTSAKAAWGCWRHLPRPGGGQLLTSCCAFAACACFQVSSCVLSKSVSTIYLSSCWAWSDFPRTGALQASFVLLHPSLRILLAMYSEATAGILMCTAVSQLSSDEFIIPPSIKYAYLLYPAILHACLLFLCTYLNKPNKRVLCWS
jgi:hypothetical protein